MPEVPTSPSTPLQHLAALISSSEGLDLTQLELILLLFQHGGAVHKRVSASRGLAGFDHGRVWRGRLGRKAARVHYVQSHESPRSGGFHLYFLRVPSSVLYPLNWGRFPAASGSETWFVALRGEKEIL